MSCGQFSGYVLAHELGHSVGCKDWVFTSSKMIIQYSGFPDSTVNISRDEQYNLNLEKSPNSNDFFSISLVNPKYDQIGELVSAINGLKEIK